MYFSPKCFILLFRLYLHCSQKTCSDETPVELIILLLDLFKSTITVLNIFKAYENKIVGFVHSVSYL